MWVNFSESFKKIFGGVFLFAIAISVLITVGFFTDKKVILKSDFTSFITGAKILLKDNENLYNSKVQKAFQYRIKEYSQSGLLPFRNPPPVAAFFTPLTFFSLETAYRFFAIFNFALYILSIYILAKTFSGSVKKSHFLIGLLFWPFYSVFIIGQISIFLFFILVLTAKFLKEKNNGSLGCASALLLIKPQFLILIPFLLILAENKKRFLKGLLIGSAAFLVFSILLVGHEALFHYPSFLVETENYLYGSGKENFLGLISILNFGVYTSLLVNFLLYFLTLGFFTQFKNSKNKHTIFGAAIIFICVFSVHLLMHDLVVLMFPLLVILIEREKSSLLLIKNRLSIIFCVIYLLPFLEFFNLAYLFPIILLFSGIYFLKTTGDPRNK